MLCTNCHREVPDTAKVCGHCGHRLVSDAAPTPVQPVAPIRESHRPPEPTGRADAPRRHRWVWALAIIIALALAGGGTGAWLLLNRDGDESALGTAAPDTTQTAPSTIAAETPSTQLLTTTQPPATTQPSPEATTSLATMPPSTARAFEGTWLARDPNDGSTMWLFVEPTSSDFRVTFYDERAAGCNGAPATWEGPARPTSDTEINVLAVSVFCLQEHGPVEMASGVTTSYRYFPDSDTIIDDFDVILWTRVPSEIDVVGDRLSLLPIALAANCTTTGSLDVGDGPEDTRECTASTTYPEGAAFYVAHGWENDELREARDVIIEGTQVVVTLDGERLMPNALANVDVESGINLSWVFVFPEGLRGNHTFVVEWFHRGVSFVRSEVGVVFG